MPETNVDPRVQSLIQPGRFTDLGPGSEDRSMLPRLESLTPQELFSGQKIANPQMAACCLSALWLYYDFLDRSHTLSQNIDTPEGSYWHAIMHRREGDFANAKYWVRRVGDHPVYGPLAEEARSLAEGQNLDGGERFIVSDPWDPYRWVDLCEAAVRGRTKAVALCQRIQQAEWKLLFAYCYEKAVAG